jgi:hypothetical protein
MRIRRTGNPKLKIIDENHKKWVCDEVYNVTQVQISNRNSYKKAWNKQETVSYMRGNITENVFVRKRNSNVLFSNIKVKYLDCYSQ